MLSGVLQVDISKDGRSLQKLRREAERAKRALSSQHQVRVEVESLAEGVDLSEPLTRARFEELNNDLFKKTLGPVKRVNQDALSLHFMESTVYIRLWVNAVIAIAAPVPSAP